MIFQEKQESYTVYPYINIFKETTGNLTEAIDAQAWACFSWTSMSCVIVALETNFSGKRWNVWSPNVDILLKSLRHLNMFVQFCRLILDFHSSSLPSSCFYYLFYLRISLFFFKYGMIGVIYYVHLCSIPAFCWATSIAASLIMICSSQYIYTDCVSVCVCVSDSNPQISFFRILSLRLANFYLATFKKKQRQKITRYTRFSMLCDVVCISYM